MKENKFKIGIEEIKEIVMTSDEKKRIFENVLASSSSSVKKLIKSPWVFQFFISSLSSKRLAYYIVIPLIFILTAGGIVFASEESLPDSLLYPIKVNIVEPILGSVIFSSKDKAQYESSLAVKRLFEAETLASLGRLDKTNEKKINDLLNKHTQALDKVLSSVKNIKQAGSQSDEIINNFNSEMNNHAQVLEAINIQKKVTRDDRGIVKDLQAENLQISNNARTNAEKIIKTFKKSDESTSVRDQSKNKGDSSFGEGKNRKND